MVVTQEKLQIIVIHPYPRNLAFIPFMFKTIRGVVGRTVGVHAGLVFIFSGIVQKCQNCPQLRPESVLKNAKIVRNKSQKKVSQNSVIYHNVRATLSD